MTKDSKITIKGRDEIEVVPNKTIKVGDNNIIIYKKVEDIEELDTLDIFGGGLSDDNSNGK